MCLFTAIDNGENGYLSCSFSATFWVGFSNTLCSHLSLTPCLSGLELSSLGLPFWGVLEQSAPRAVLSCGALQNTHLIPQGALLPAWVLLSSLFGTVLWEHFPVNHALCISCEGVWNCEITSLRSSRYRICVFSVHRISSCATEGNWIDVVGLPYFSVDYCSSWLFLGANK